MRRKLRRKSDLLAQSCAIALSYPRLFFQFV